MTMHARGARERVHLDRPVQGRSGVPRLKPTHQARRPSTEGPWPGVTGRLRTALLERLARLRASAVGILQTATGAASAWAIASSVLGHRGPFLACVAAVLSVGATSGRPTRRAVEVIVGVAVGVTIADRLVHVIGPGATSIFAVTALAMSAGLLLGGGPMLVTQAGISAILIAAVPPPPDMSALDRLVDALVGGAVALVVTGLLPSDPIAPASRALRALLDDLAAALEESAAALTGGDTELASRALRRARALDARVASLEQAIDAGLDTARLAPARRAAVPRLRRYAHASGQLDLVVRNIRVLARAVGRVARSGPGPLSLADAIRQLADAVRALEECFRDPERRPSLACSLALEAARRASAVVGERSDPSIVVVISHVRSAAIDLLRATGMDEELSRRKLEEAAGTLGQQR
jgi:uncharacterized membrane protein YgaE (UPF0421/DUF939 family)